LDGLRHPRRGRALVPGSRAAAALSIVGTGHQLLAAVPAEPEVVDERGSGHRDLHRGVRVQLPGRRAPRRVRPAAAPERVTAAAIVAQVRKYQDPLPPNGDCPNEATGAIPGPTCR